MSARRFPLSPVIAEVGTYPFARLDEAKRAAVARGVRMIDFGVGDPREPTAPFIRRALLDGVRETMEYPKAAGLPELRRAIAEWVQRRFGVTLDPDAEVVPTLGSKEVVFSLAQVVVDPAGGRDLVIATEPGYPVPLRGARFAGASALALPLHESNGFLPDIDAVPAATWGRAALVWVNYPNNPTGAVAPLSFHVRLAELAARHGFLIASDEAYSELAFGDQMPPSALQVPDRSRIAVVNTLSKRSSMTGYRSGFLAGPPELLRALAVHRPSVGTAPQEFVQRAAVAAWGDEAHVREARERYRLKREIVRGALEGRGLRIAGSEATMYLWVAVPAGEDSEGFARRLLAHGIAVAPGAFLGPSGEGYVRFALVPTIDDCRRAAAILEEVL
ncbi:MAG TPA: aminotransferase class I/II-fold pyridoxal phosphate-dependent enzyme [Miltoncostaeaceae bacterium]|nr:aminotransferase class I/II-fold pyridoxal phosphate-dependent enzyme [Miltoncostaeaceae bacterium]